MRGVCNRCFVPSRSSGNSIMVTMQGFISNATCVQGNIFDSSHCASGITLVSRYACVGIATMRRRESANTDLSDWFPVCIK